MKKLTEEKCHELIGALFYYREEDGISTREEYYLQALQIALDSMRAPDVDKWIEITSKEPAPGQEVLIKVLVEGKTRIEPAVYHDGWFSGSWFDCIQKGELVEFTHWQPLPRPPEDN